MTSCRTRASSVMPESFIDHTVPTTVLRLAVRVNPVVAKTDMDKPLSMASDGGQIDILREREDITESELQQGLAM
jgi:hypothetical protein